MIAVISAHGQQSLPALHKRVILRSEDIRFDSLLHLTSKQTGMRFSLNTQKFRPSKIIHVRKGECSIAELLAEIRTNTGIRYTILGDHIIFIDPPHVQRGKAPVDHNSASAPKPASASLHNPAAASFQYPANKEEDSIVRSEQIAIQSYFVHNNTFHMDTLSRVAVDKKYLARVNRLNPLPPASGTDRSDKNSRNKIRPDKEHEAFASNLFVRPGLIIGETFYINPSIQAGLPFIYGIASWSTNFKVSGFRYGIGGSIRISDPWRLNLTATTGANAKKYIMDSSSFTKKLLIVKTHLHMIGLLAEQSINKKLLLQFGPILNILQTKYYINGVLSPTRVDESTVNNQYTYIKPIYTLRDSYSSNAAQNTKIWVGLQASLFYNINFGRKR